MVHVKTITESGDPGCDLIELDAFLTPISLTDKHGCSVCVTNREKTKCRAFTSEEDGLFQAESCSILDKLKAEHTMR
jgi:hypothetical protein